MSVIIVSFFVICSTLNAAAGDDILKPKMDQPVPKKPTENEKKLTQLLHYAPPVYTKKQKNKCSLEDRASQAASKKLENLVAQMAKNQNTVETDAAALKEASTKRKEAHERIVANSAEMDELRRQIADQQAKVQAAIEAEAAATGQAPPLSDSVADIEQSTEPDAEEIDAVTKAAEAAAAAAAEESGFTGDDNVESGEPSKATSQSEEGTDDGAVAAPAGPLSDDPGGPLSDDVSGGDDSEEGTTDDKNAGFRPMVTFLLLAPLLAFL
jgi:phage shock protein A